MMRLFPYSSKQYEYWTQKDNEGDAWEEKMN